MYYLILRQPLRYEVFINLNERYDIFLFVYFQSLEAIFDRFSTEPELFQELGEGRITILIIKRNDTPWYHRQLQRYLDYHLTERPDYSSKRKHT